MLLVPPGSFQMGCSQAPADQQCFSFQLPVHDVAITRAFYLGRYEVTAGQYAGQTDGSRLAAASMTWNSAKTFLEARGMRFPTEAEWEFACKAGTSTPYHSGPGFPQGSTDPNDVSQIAWCCINEVQEVGQKAGNALGFHDMIGNVWEHVGDFFATYPSTPQVDPTGPASGSSKVHRGGSFGDSTGTNGYISSTGRSYFGTADDAAGNVGFRVARNP
jgi:formylglycine-generating enzyme required for sulfatase activity